MSLDLVTMDPFENWFFLSPAQLDPVCDRRVCPQFNAVQSSVAETYLIADERLSEVAVCSSSTRPCHPHPVLCVTPSGRRMLSGLLHSFGVVVGQKQMWFSNAGVVPQGIGEWCRR